MTRTNTSSTRPPEPAAPQNPDTLPPALPVFLNRAERRAVLAALKPHHPDRARALLRALDIEPRTEQRADG